MAQQTTPLLGGGQRLASQKKLTPKMDVIRITVRPVQATREIININRAPNAVRAINP